MTLGQVLIDDTVIRLRTVVTIIAIVISNGVIIMVAAWRVSRALAMRLGKIDRRLDTIETSMREGLDHRVDMLERVVFGKIAEDTAKAKPHPKVG